jgi:hypothetical protein
LPKKINPCILQRLNPERDEGRIFEVAKSTFSDPQEKRLQRVSNVWENQPRTFKVRNFSSRRFFTAWKRLTDGSEARADCKTVAG